MWRMLCKLVTLCGACEGVCHTQVTNMTQQMSVPVGQMDFKAEWLHVWGTRHGWMTDGVVLQGKMWSWGITVTNFFKYIKQGCKNPRCQFAWVTKFCAMVANYCTFFPFLKQKVPDNSKVNGSQQNCGYSGWTLLYFTIMASRLWRWLLGVRKICVPLY
jgi:hypothetical protein